MKTVVTIMEPEKSKIENVLNRQFQEQKYRNVVVSDLTYVRVGLKWNYVNWYNKHRIHFSLGYQTQVQFKENNLKKVV